MQRVRSGYGLEVFKLPEKILNPEESSKIKKQPSPFYPPPFKISKPVPQKYAPAYYGHGVPYVPKGCKNPGNPKKSIP
ncbi:MAG: hypothetical protein BWY80_01511 [Firmicutes bacterium ADurb.Bin456]|nr:MAG: hypothetical protein BWY80_01511 [Firmicutes bacterium ADurb.Bin456]